MPVPWQTVRIFISSTFKDMQAERDHLVRFVFPRLREELVKYRIHIVDVDLRWGVTSDQNALGVCREVIDECQPRFMCMLGGRYGSVPGGRDISITADEIHYGVLGREAAKREHAFFFFRHEAATARMVEEKPGDFREAEGSDGALKLADLKKSVTDAGLSRRIYGEGALWDAAQKRLTGLEAFGNQVHDDLLQSLMDDPEFAAHFAPESTAPPDEFAEEAEQMDAFIEERTERYVTGSRQPLFDELNTFATTDGTPNVFILTGDPGSGKSAFLAKFARELATHQPSRFVISHFIGASTGSTDLRRTLRRLCHKLAIAAENTEPLPLDIRDLITHFHKLLAEAADRQGIILIFDALNQLDETDGAHWMNWLPQPDKLPPGARIVASVIAPSKGEEEHKTLAILKNRPDVRLDELKDLTGADTLAIIEGYLKRYSKRLSEEQIALLKEKPASNLPLYVLTALEELRTLGTYQEITNRIIELPGDARALFGWILTERLAHDPGFRNGDGKLCGPNLVGKFAACLGVSRHGLSPAELTALLDPGDPLGNVAALLRLLRPYLMRRGELLDFYHGQFREAAGAAHLDTPEKQRVAHQSVATCLQAFADPHRDGQCRDATPHALSELPHHQTRAEAWSDLIATLENIFFLEAKVTHGMTFDLAEDFTGTVDVLPPEHLERQRLRLLLEALRRDIHFIARHANDYPQALFQCVWNSAWWYDCPDAAHHYAATEEEGPHEAQPWERTPPDLRLSRLLECWHVKRDAAKPSSAWVRSLRPPFMPLGAGQIAILSGHENYVTCVAYSPDGQFVLSGSMDRTVRVWEARSGECVAILSGHDDYVSCVAYSPDGCHVLSGSGKIVRLWDARSWVCLLMLRHECEVSCATYSPDGRHVLIGSGNEMLIWNTNGEDRATVLAQHTNGVYCVAYSPDGRNVISGSGYCLRVWDVQTGECLTTLRGHENFIRSVSYSPDGSYVVSGSWDATVRMWNPRSGRELAVLGRHNGEVSSVAYSPDGRLVISGSWDKTIRIWEVESGRELVILRGHEEIVVCVACSPDGRYLLSGALDDRAVRMWDALSRRKATFLNNHGSWVNSVAFSVGGRRLASGAGVDFRGRDRTVRIWDSKSGRKLVVLCGHEGNVSDVSYSSDGTLLFSASDDDKSVRIWDPKSEECLAVLSGHESWVRFVLSPDCSLMLTSSESKVRVWQARSGECVGVPLLELAVHCLGYSFDGRFVCGGAENDVVVWDAKNWQELARLQGHWQAVICVTFMSDGSLLASGSNDGTVRVWDWLRMQQLTIMRGHEESVYEVAFSPNGRRLISQSFDKTIRIWDVQSGECLELLHGTGDITAIAADTNLFPWRSMSRNGETVVEPSNGDPPVAWFPDPLYTVATHPEGRIWAGGVKSHLILLQLDGLGN